MSKMRETVKVKELAGEDWECLPEDWETCEEVSKTVHDYDLGKGYITWDVVVKRLSDGRFFQFSFTETQDDNFFSKIATEVFEKQATIYG